MREGTEAGRQAGSEERGGSRQAGSERGDGGRQAGSEGGGGSRQGVTEWHKFRATTHKAQATRSPVSD